MDTHTNRVKPFISIDSLHQILENNYFILKYTAFV